VLVVVRNHTAVRTSSSAYALARATMETVVTGLGAGAWRVAPHSAFLGRKDDLRRVADAIASGAQEQGD
jgi:hypothetical protein